MIKMIKENYNDFDEVNRFKVCLYYDPQFRDVAECEVFDDLSDAENHAHTLLQWGDVSIEDYFVGELDIDSDDYWDNFDGEFACLPTIANWQNEVWKSMGIKTESKKRSRKVVKESVSGKIPYDLVSMLVIIRDYRDTSSAYVNEEHKKLVDIADSLYNANIRPENMSKEYRDLYNKYGKKYFDKVLDDALAIDSQVGSGNIKDLLTDYTDRANSFLGESVNRKSVKEDISDYEKSFKEADMTFTREGVTYFIRMVELDASGDVAEWWDSSDNGLGYNNKGWVKLWDRNTLIMKGITEVSPQNVRDILNVYSAYDRRPNATISKRIIDKVVRKLDYDWINDVYLWEDENPWR